MRFADPMWLVVGAVSVAVLVALLVRAERRRAAALAVLRGAGLRAPSASVPSPPSAVRRWARMAIVTLSMAMGFAALARPQRGMHWETMDRKGTDLLLVVDTSRSMDADDVKPTRLERVKLGIRDLVDKFPGDRVGLVAFAGDAFVESPMTLDHGALLETVDALDTSVVQPGGTNIGRGIDVAAAALATEPGHQKEIVLLTDGEDLEGRGLEEAKKAAGAGITIDAVGVGSPEGELVPARDDKGRVAGIVRDEKNVPVRSRLDEAGLRAIVAATHGSYRPLGSDGRGLDRLYEESLAPRAHVEASSRTRRVYSEWFQIPLSLALVGIVLDALLALRWRRASRRATRRLPARTVTAAAAALALALVPGRADASPGHAAEAYAKGHFDASAKEYAAESAKDPKDPRLAFNAGDAAYRAGNYAGADAAFEQAAKAADPKLKEQALYNRGNGLYRLGESHLADDRPQTIEHWKAAITAYEAAMTLDPTDGDARFNRDFVKRKLAALEQQEKGKEKEAQDPKQGSQKQDRDRKGGSGGKGPKPGEQTRPPKPQGDTGGEAAARPGELSPRDARALLGALRGEERRGIVRGTDTHRDKPSDDAPGKDW